MDSLNFFNDQWVNILTVTLALFTIIIVLKVVEAKGKKVSTSENFNTQYNQSLLHNETSIDDNNIYSSYIMPEGKNTDVNYYLSK